MSERTHGDGDFDKVFDELAAKMFADDPDFERQMLEANDAIDLADVASLPVGDRVADDEVYYGESIQDVVDEITDAFRRACAMVGLDPNTAGVGDPRWGSIEDEVSRVACSLTDRLKAGDVITASDAIVVEIPGDGGELEGVESIVTPPEHQVVMQFIAPIIGRMPDEAFVFTGVENGYAPYGIGFLAQNPAMIDGRGKTLEGEFRTDTVVVVLGTLGLYVEKIHYDESVFPESDQL